MKRITVLGLIGLLMLTGCTNDETTEGGNTDDSKIRFDCYVPTATTRDGYVGPIGATDRLKYPEVGFGVYSHYNSSTTADFMNNQQVLWSGSNWYYTPARYWPNNDGETLTFFAYAPYVSQAGTYGIQSVTSSLTAPTINYKNGKYPADCQDLLVSPLLKDRKKSEGTVNFTFQHALAAVNINCKASTSSSMTIKIKSLTINSNSSGFPIEGTCTVGTTPTWSATTNGTYTYSETDLNNFNNQGVTATARNIFTGLPTNSKENEEWLLMIPYDGKLSFTMTYTVKEGGNSYDVTISKDMLDKVEMGKKYTINLTIGLTAIQVGTVNVGNWSTTTI